MAWCYVDMLSLLDGKGIRVLYYTTHVYRYATTTMQWHCVTYHEGETHYYTLALCYQTPCYSTAVKGSHHYTTLLHHGPDMHLGSDDMVSVEMEMEIGITIRITSGHQGTH